MNRAIVIAAVGLMACGGPSGLADDAGDDAAPAAWCDVPIGDAGAAFGAQCGGGGGIFWSWGDAGTSCTDAPCPSGSSCGWADRDSGSFVTGVCR